MYTIQCILHAVYCILYSDSIYIYIKLIKKATESAQPVWELDVQQRNYFVLITIVLMYGISNTSHQIRYKIVSNNSIK